MIRAVALTAALLLTASPFAAQEASLWKVVRATVVVDEGVSQTFLEVV